MSKLVSMLVFSILFVFSINSEKKYYTKKYFNNGILKSEGWMKGNDKIKYWYSYDSNGEIKSKGHYSNNLKEEYWYYYNKNNFKTIEGHYQLGLKTGWWTYINTDGSQIKTQYLNDKKHGVTLYYKKGRKLPFKAKRYKEGKYLGTWTTISDFKRDNPDIEY